MVQFWMAETIKTLQLLEQRKMAIGALNIQIRGLDADVASLSGRGYGSTPVQGGGNRQEERLARWIDKKARLERERDKLVAIVEHTEECLARLPERERAVVTAFYLSNISRCEAVRKLEQELYVSEATVYRLREKALTVLAMMMGYI